MVCLLLLKHDGTCLPLSLNGLVECLVDCQLPKRDAGAFLPSGLPHLGDVKGARPGCRSLELC